MLARWEQLSVCVCVCVCVLRTTEARAAGAFVTKPDNKISRVLKSLLRDMPQQIEVSAMDSCTSSHIHRQVTTPTCTDKPSTAQP